MVARALVHFYCLLHGKLHLPGAGWLIRRMARFLPDLSNFEYDIPGVGTALLDFRDIAAFGLLNYSLGDYGDDKALLNIIGRVLRPGQVLWDIGANIGYFSMYFAQRPHQVATICAFEPNPKAYRQLQALYRNNPTVRTFPFGLGAKDEEVEMSVPETGSQLGSLTRKVDPGGAIKVCVRRGDNLKKEMSLPSPDVLKIDVEGFEPQVLSGLEETIAASRPLIFFEHIWLTAEEVKKMTPKDFFAYLLLDNGEITDDWNLKPQTFNGVFVPREKQSLVENSKLNIASS